MIEPMIPGISMVGAGCMVALIVLGSTLQVVTGVGLGLIAGPALLFFIDSTSAIQIAIVLNIVLTVVLLFADRAHVSKPWLLSLSLWAFVAIPVGFALLLVLDQSVLKILGALFIFAALIQLRYFPVTTHLGTQSVWPMRTGGVVAGLLTGSLAAPGPAALWALLSSGADALTARATIRYYFLIAYSFALTLHWSLVGLGDGIYRVLAFLLPALFAGIVCGFFIRSIVAPNVLMKVLQMVLLAMAASLLIKGVIDLASIS